MRFLTDQDVYAVTVQLLRDCGHDVATASTLNMSRATDTSLLQTSKRQEYIFVTRDRDFGNLVFVDQLATGVIYLRMSPSTLSAVHAELERVLEQYQESDLHHSFIVVQPGRHRTRRLPEAGTSEESV